jgi:Hypervirulence associated proteins TUDOR domain
MADNGHKPTSGMKSAARRALAWHKDGKRGGTSVGYARANQIVAGESLSDDTVKRMYSFFSRHEVDKKATGFNSGEEGYPSPGRVAWDLWGGDAGYAFARSKVKHTIKKMIMDEIGDLVKASGKSIKVGQMVSWGSSGGSATGKVVKVKKKGSIKVPDSSFTITGTEDNPAVLIRVYQDGKPTDTLVGHKMNTLRSIKKTIGGSSSQHQYEDEAGTPESYVRNGGEKENMSENIEKTTTEPDPKGDIAVLKSVDSDLARRKIQKAIISLEKAMANMPDTGRASSVSVSNETAPMSKAVDTDNDGKTDSSRPTSDAVSSAVTKSASDYLYSAKKAIKKALANLPDTGRAGSVSVSNETAPVKKDVGNATDVEGVGENSKPANDTVSQDAKPMTKACTCGDCPECLSKAACCKAAGPDCTGDCCTKCACMGMNKAADTDNDDDAVKKSADDVVAESQSKTSLDMINDAKVDLLSKSVWGGAFGAPGIPRIK